MSTDTSFITRSHEENWRPVLDLAVEEVFEIMLGSRVVPVAAPAPEPKWEFTAMVGLAGALCGILSICCEAETAGKLAKAMLGETAESKDQVSDALGEICNMVAGNFKNKLAGTDERCMLSVPTVIMGGEYSFRSMAEGNSLETVMQFEGAPVAIRLQLQS